MSHPRPTHLVPVLSTVLLSAALTESGSQLDTTEVFFAPGQIIVEFEPGVVLLDPVPSERFIPIGDVSFAIPELRAGLLNLGIVGFEVFARHWRRIEPEPTWNPEETNHVPVMLKSFRHWYVLHFPSTQSLEWIVSATCGLPGVRTVGRNPVFQATDYWPSDTLLGCPDPCNRNYQWNMENIGGEINGVTCDESTDIGLRGAYAIQETCTVKIGLADTGADRDHPDLDDNLDGTLGRNFTNNPTDTLAWDDGGASAGHGTSTAGILGALHSADSSVVGVCGLIKPNTPIIVPLKVFSNATARDTASSICTWIIDAMSYTASLSSTIPILIIEADLAELYHDPAPFDSSQFIRAGDVAALKNATYNAYHENLLILASAGNRHPSPGRGCYPADFLHMVTGVTAIGCDGSRDDVFHDGKHVDLAAPGSADDESSGRGTPQIVTTGLGGGYLVDDDSLFSATSAAIPHVGGAAGLLLSHTSQLTNEDIREVLYRTARDMGSPGYDIEYGHGLLRIDDALELLNDYETVHDSTSTIDSRQLESSCATQYFRDVTLLATPAHEITDWDTLKAEVYRFETTVDLTQNTNSSHVPDVWTRGRQCISARDMLKYDGKFEPYFAEVVSVSYDEATLRGHTYKVFTRYSNCEGDSLIGWFPIDPYAEQSSRVFSYTYLADATSGDWTPTCPGNEIDAEGSRPSLILAGETAKLRFMAPSSAGGTLRLYDVAGRLVRELEIPPGEKGPRECQWHANRHGTGRLERGVYWGTLRLGQGVQELRSIVLR